jgi:putative ABC transport system permease protein
MRVVRQLLVESLLLGAIGCILGVALAHALLPLLVQLAPRDVPRLEQASIDPAVLLFCIACAFVSSLLFGLAPALQASRVDPSEGLRAGTSRGVLGGDSSRLRRFFVTAEVSLSLVLLVSAGLLLKSLAALTAVDLGFHANRLLVAEVSVPLEAARASVSFYQPLLARLENSPGIRSAAFTHTLPGEADTRSDGIYIVTGQTIRDLKAGGPEAGFSVISPGYFKTLDIPLTAGREFSERDGSAAPPVAIISGSLARRSFGKIDPLGQTISCGLDYASLGWMKIVGVAADVRMDGPAQRPAAEIYFPYLQHPREDGRLIVRVAGDPLASAADFRRMARALNPEASAKLSTMETHLSSAIATPRFSTRLLTVLAALAMLLAMIGIYAVISYSVAQRTAEIGLRAALGASRRTILAMVFRQAMSLTGAGILIGVGASFAAARLLRAQLFQVSAADPAIYCLTVALLAFAALAAGAVPAWRASRVEPLEALRQE